jgi:hypothetical protein
MPLADFPVRLGEALTQDGAMPPCDLPCLCVEAIGRNDPL